MQTDPYPLQLDVKVLLFMTVKDGACSQCFPSRVYCQLPPALRHSHCCACHLGMNNIAFHQKRLQESPRVQNHPLVFLTRSRLSLHNLSIPAPKAKGRNQESNRNKNRFLTQGPFNDAQHVLLALEGLLLRTKRGNFNTDCHKKKKKKRQSLSSQQTIFFFCHDSHQVDEYVGFFFPCRKTRFCGVLRSERGAGAAAADSG